MISKIEILGGKAIIKQNKFGVWQFRMWISGEKKYVEKSLRTEKSDSIYAEIPPVIVISG